VTLRARLSSSGSSLRPQGLLEGLLNGDLHDMAGSLSALPVRIGIVAICALNLFLLSRLIAGSA